MIRGRSLTRVAACTLYPRVKRQTVSTLPLIIIIIKSRNTIYSCATVLRLSRRVLSLLNSLQSSNLQNKKFKTLIYSVDSVVRLRILAPTLFNSVKFYNITLPFATVLWLIGPFDSVVQQISRILPHLHFKYRH